MMKHVGDREASAGISSSGGGRTPSIQCSSLEVCIMVSVLSYNDGIKGLTLHMKVSASLTFCYPFGSRKPSIWRVLEE